MSTEHERESKILKIGVTLILIVPPLILLIINIIHDYWGYRPCTYSKSHLLAHPPAIPKFKWNDTGLVTLWFDDGLLSQYTEALPIMNEMGYVGALSITVKFACQPNYMTWREMYKMQTKGWETTDHSMMHQCDQGSYSLDNIYRELVLSQKIIRENGLRAQQFVIPCGIGYYGSITPSQYAGILVTAKKNYSSIRTSNGQFLNTLPVTNPYYLFAFILRNDTPLTQIQFLIRLAAGQKKWLILVFHEVDDKNRPYGVTPETFKAILRMIREANLPVVLPSQALAIE